MEPPTANYRVTPDCTTGMYTYSTLLKLEGVAVYDCVCVGPSFNVACTCPR